MAALSPKPTIAGLVTAGLLLARQVSGQCFQLTGSAACPAFTTQYINPTNLSGSWPFFTAVTDVNSFDTAFDAYLTDPNQFRQTKYVDQLGCPASAASEATDFTLQWTRTYLCGEFTQISYTAGCYTGTNVVRTMTCQDTCVAFADAENTLVNNSAVCPSNSLSTAARDARLTQDFTSCTDWPSLTSTNYSLCVKGSTNEGNCGFGTSTSQLCNYCNPSLSSSGEVDSCCTGTNTDITSCGFVLAASQVTTSVYPTATVPSSASAAASLSSAVASLSSAASAAAAAAATGTAGSGGSGSAGAGSDNGGTATSTGGSGLSSGAKAGIGVGAAIGALILLALLFLLCSRMRKRNKSGYRDSEASMLGVGGGPNNSSHPSSGVLAGGAMAEKDLEKPILTKKSTQTSSSKDAPSTAATTPSGIGEKGSKPNSLKDPFSDAAAGAFGGGALAGAGALALHEKDKDEKHDTDSSGEDRPVSGATNTTGSSNEGRSLVASYRDQYSATDITPGSEVVAIYAYNPNLPDELKLEPDTVIVVRKIFDDGWAVGSIKGAAPTEGPKEGAFPLVVCCAAGSDAADGLSSSSSLSDPTSRSSSFHSASQQTPAATPGSQEGGGNGFFSNLLGTGRR
ncbi:uncharacterized protein L969DRAFT_20128 [Mixia osmundae IAM 14324]|uniref:SH3 domain-containing protein n=1 Tax=Mixia osmundae (strain CBS 9802 / IAM 14324 / JCM 22182 / KY 12970) TaxID=764103 RepID=G7E1S4_MIXOS|nr:uncharacterized protein L969DRAFT_20128 [Mixia osmundae IAM 14324]KEI36733.1 hypothetical protein L969DRAFT_20128 [Mixia osmundae IAM 14324]GAA96784.1 hypothetical protein E5Q_03455 [Mixia osmundae IAM 14324]